MQPTTTAIAGLLLAASTTVLAQSVSTQYTATGTADVAAARATAKTLSPVSHVKGHVFDRIAIIWLENTDYDLAAGDPNLAWLAEKGIKLENHFAVTHPSEPNYVAVGACVFLHQMTH
jgi:acid phosphatase